MGRKTYKEGFSFKGLEWTIGTYFGYFKNNKFQVKDFVLAFRRDNP
jgi:hypothetical protein